MPQDCKWSGTGFYQTSHHAWKAQEYAHKFDGFKAAWQAARRAPAVPETIEQRAKKLKGLQVLIGATAGVPEAIELARSRFTEAYGRSPLHDDLAYACLLIDAYGGAPAVPVPRFNHPAKRKLELLTGEGATITGYAFQSEGRRGSIDCHGFVAWFPEPAAAPRPPEASLVPSIAVTPEMVKAANEAYCPFGDMELALCAALQVAPIPPGAAPVQLPEPVAAESRFTTFAGDRWRWCTVEHARAFGADKGYEVRYLYTEQQVRDLLAASKVERKPLTDEAIRTLYGESDGHWQMVGPQVLCFARSIESVHGIQEQST
ncbi:hypothetical protein [Comamonas jiangduensis]